MKVFRTVTLYDGDIVEVEVNINIDNLCVSMATRCDENVSSKAQSFHGDIKAKIVKRISAEPK